MSDDNDDQNDDYESQEGQSSSKSSLKKYFNKSSSCKSLLNIQNNINLSNGLKLNLDNSISSNKIYKGKYRLNFDLSKQTKFKLNFNSNDAKYNMSVKHKNKNYKNVQNVPIDSYDIKYQVYSNQDMNIELNLDKNIEENMDLKLTNKLQFSSNKFNWMINTKFIYHFPSVVIYIKNKMTIKLKNYSPEVIFNTSLINNKFKLYIDTSLSQKADNYLEKVHVQFQYQNFTTILQHHKSSTLYFHYLSNPYSIGFKVRQPDGKNWWELAFNRRVSSKKLIQLSFDNKRAAFLLKHNINSSINCYLKWINEYNLNIFDGWKKNVQIGFKFNC